MLTELEKKIIRVLQNDIPVIERPYLIMAGQLGISEETLLDTVKTLSDRGIIRRFGASLRHQKSGFTANVMVAWKVEEARVEEVGQIMASFKEVSHCYRRDPSDRWPYNLYTMVHGRDEASCREIVQRLKEKASVDTCSLLFSRRELKKVSMQYFSDETEG